MAHDFQPFATSEPGGQEGTRPVQAVPALDRLAALVGRLLRVPLALVSLVEEDRQKFPGMYGSLPEPFHQRQTPISHSLCQHVVHTGQPLIIQDARLDGRVLDNPAVRDLGVIAYLGMPLTTADGQVLGSLCAIDTVPRIWTEEEQGTLRELVGFALTELEAHRNEQRLREVEQALATKTGSERDRLIEAFRRSPSFIAVLRGPQHVYEFANDAYCQLIGRVAQDILERPVREVLPELEDQGFFGLLDQVHTTGKPHTGKDVPVMLQSKPGQPSVEHFIDFVFQPTRAADGSVDGIVAHGVDWTERKLAQRATAQLSEQRRLALDSAQMGWWQYDLASGRVLCDDRFKAIFGTDKEEVSYDWVLSVIHPEDSPRIDASVQAAVRPVAPVPYSAEYRLVREDGSLVWATAKGQAIFEGEGAERRAVSLVGTVTDVTSEKEAAQVLAASEARGAYLIRLSDALRPLSDPGEVQAAATRLLGERLGVNRVAYFEIEGGDYVIEQDYVSGTASFVGRHPVAAFGSLILDRLRDGQVVVETDTSTTAGRSETERAAFASLSIGAIATVPLVKDGRFVAGLTAHTISPRTWSSDDLWAIGETAERTWAAVERARAERALRAKESASRFLADLADATRQTTNPDAVLGRVVDSLQTHLAADRCAYVEVQEDQNTITIRYDRANPAGSNRSLAGQYHLSDFGQHMQPTLFSGQTVVVTDFSTDALFADARTAMAAVDVAALVNVPLVKAGRLVAVLAVNDLQPRRWTDDEIALIEAVAERSWGEVERSRNARALAFERHQLAVIFRESPAAMALWQGDDLVFTRVNPEYQGLFGGRPLVGLPLLQACPELVGQGFDDLLRQVLHTGKPFTGHEVLARIQRDKDGPVEDRYFDFTYLQVHDPDGRPWGVYDHAVDVTDRVLNRLALEQSRNDLRESLADREHLLNSERAARAEAERISHVKDEFLATLSHELRTPLNAILGWTQVLRGDPANTEDIESGLATIERNSRAQTQIIEDLLDMSKIISGKVRLDVQPLHLDQVVAAAVETMQPAAAAKGIRLQILVDPQARMISGDPNRLQQVFWNLLSNALKFTPKNGKVQVVLERVNSHLEVSISDTGEGIAPEFLPYVFDRFRQQDASTTRKHGGLGLGLAIVKQLVELHGGSIQVESAGPGRGSTFKVLLPLSVMQPAPDPADPDRRHPQSGAMPLRLPADRLNLAGVKVLVVDDEADARTLVQRLLEDRGATVQTAGNVADAMELIQSQRPDVLVSDIGMPGEDGYALIAQVRALPAEQGGNTPAVALTAYARSEDRLKVILAGFQMHLAKPVEAAELLALVASLAGRVAAAK